MYYWGQKVQIGQLAIGLLPGLSQTNGVGGQGLYTYSAALR